ncbi:hypothetical protein BO78DRAFT_444274 [Aspergillus sclerotiicarbonarius CBS 121057]|uniref:Zn(2)-C6 fungal-type domain-containing protein n=1 Tax=Aspergillus sclerotiicarbonarius (strain CBS 121057 / IBT 28362) TaxID=1448318 RepID=A0A319EAL3_ASPSB|nr:hypothetical protein BO78DRAFT_444274 [Aspergillus sclerotiicarbonarius CBS 121057]
MEDSTSFAPRACVACRKLKRGCDKGLPSCSLCTRTSRECDYSEISPADEINQLRTKVRELEDSIPVPSHATGIHVAVTDTSAAMRNKFLQLSLLDSEVLDNSGLVPSPVDVAVPPSVLDLLGDVDLHQLGTEYFGSVHTWMPIISKRRFDKLLGSLHLSLSAPAALMLLGMKLVLEKPTDLSPGQSLLYTVTKQFTHALDSAGSFSLMKLQGKLLIAVYEMGQMMLSAAYLSIADCARQGILMGIHDKSAPQLLQQPRQWVDWEERQRVWWLIIILDRYISMGSTHRPLCTADPSKDSCIPSNEQAWASGEMLPPERVYLSSPTKETASPFARLAQASNLLGRVIRHVDDEPSDPQEILYEIQILSDALFSLLDLIKVDSLGREAYWAARSVCYSALLKLSDSHSCDSFPEEKSFDISAAPIMRQCTDISLQIMKRVSTEIVSMVQMMDRHVQAKEADQFSPLELHCIYRAAATMAWMGLNTGDEQYMIGKGICIEWLGFMSSRWRTAGRSLYSI